MPRFIRTIAVFFLILLALPGLAEQERIALVIGNADYPSGGRLANPVNDARAMQDALERAGFQVIKLENAGMEDMESAILKFSRKLNKNTVALFYYSGHGLQYDGNNYLIPIDTSGKIEAPAQLRSKAVSVDYILASMENSALNIVIFDACRSVPFRTFQRSIPSGLAAMSNYPDGTLIAYATAPGKVALDGRGENSPYTASLVKHMAEPLTLEQLLKKVRSDVRAETGDSQSPWYNASIEGDFYFTKPDAQGNATTSNTPAISGADEDSVTLEEALDAYNKEDFPLALKRLQPLAAQGNGVASQKLGHLYCDGLGVSRDYDLARKFYEQAVKQGNLKAKTSLGYLYAKGLGVNQDYDKALALFEQAAKEGDAIAQDNLGTIYRKGLLGVSQNYEEARRYYEQAAVQGHAKAQYALGEMYRSGLGVDKDEDIACVWFGKAAEERQDATWGDRQSRQSILEAAQKALQACQ